MRKGIWVDLIDIKATNRYRKNIKEIRGFTLLTHLQMKSKWILMILLLIVIGFQYFSDRIDTHYSIVYHLAYLFVHVKCKCKTTI